MTVYKNKMYVYGGFVGTSATVAVADYLNDIWSFDLSMFLLRNWHLRVPFPMPATSACYCCGYYTTAVAAKVVND